MRSADAAQHEAAAVRALLRRGAAGTAALHAVARGLGFLTTVVLASVLGAEDFGAYAWATATIAILRVPASLGRERLLVREVARDAARGDWGLLRGVLRQAARVVTITSLAAALACVGIAVAVDSPLADALGYAAALLPLGALLLVTQAALQGLQRVVASIAPDAVVRPVVLLALLGALPLAAGVDWSAESALGASTAATLAALLATAWLLRRHSPEELRAAEPRTTAREWNRSGLVLAANATLGIVSQRADLVLVGVLAGASDAGVYGLAVATAGLPALALMAGTAPLAPLVARLHALGRPDRIADTLRTTTRAIFAATVAIAVPVAVAGPFALDLLGSRYAAGAGALALLCLAAVVNAAFAANTLTLLMTGHERAAARATGAGAATTVAGALVLVPPLGIAGGALAALAGVAVRNGLATRSAWRELGIDTSVRGTRVTMSRVPIELRTVDPEEPDALRCLDAYFAELRRRAPDRFFDPGSGATALPHEVRPPHGVFVVAYRGDEAVGCGAVKHHADGASDVKRMWIDESARGLGLGRRLLAHLEEIAREHGSTTARMETNDALTEAIALYEDAGYREVEPFNAEPFADRWLAKPLTRP